MLMEDTEEEQDDDGLHAGIGVDGEDSKGIGINKVRPGDV